MLIAVVAQMPSLPFIFLVDAPKAGDAMRPFDGNTDPAAMYEVTARCNVTEVIAAMAKADAMTVPLMSKMV